jgi:hypothetical protein
MDFMSTQLPPSADDAVVAAYSLQAICRHEAGKPVV